MRSIIFGILTLFAITDVKAQDLDSLILYETTEQFLKKLPSCTNATAEIIRSNPNSMELFYIAYDYHSIYEDSYYLLGFKCGVAYRHRFGE